MARKGDQLPEDHPDDYKGPAIQGVEEINKLAAAASKANAAKAKAEARKSNIPDEVYIRNWDAIDAAQKAVDKRKEEYDQAKGVLSQKYATAKNDGCNVDALKRVRTLAKHDLDDLDLELRAVARIVGLVGSPLGQLSFFAPQEAAPKANPFLQGFTAGKAGDAAAGNPLPPGSEEFILWEQGRKQGAEKLEADFTPKTKKGQKLN